MRFYVRGEAEGDSRLILEATESFEEGSVYALLEDGGLCVNVAQEHAMDSYNESFTCSHTMTREQALKLRDWLVRKFAPANSPTT